MRRRIRKDESGVAAVEAAISALVLFTMIFAVLELGYMFRDYQIASDATSDGARMAAVIGPAGDADFEIVTAMREALGSMPPEWINRIVIFRGTGGTASAKNQITDACKSGTPVNGRCSVYADVEEAFLAVEAGDLSYFACPGGAACSWAPAARKDGPTVTDIDYVGVYVDVDRDFLTGLFGQTMTIQEASVARIEVGDLSP